MQQYPPKKKKKSVAELYAVSRWKQGTLCLAYISLTPAFEYKIAVHKEGRFVWTWERERTKSCFWKEKKAEGEGGGGATMYGTELMINTVKGKRKEKETN